MRRSLVAGLLALVALIGGVIGHQLNEHPRVQAVITKAALEIDKEGTRYLRWLGFSCGVEAWSVKTLTDSAANAVDLTPRLTNIPTLVALVGSPGQRTFPPETFRLRGTHLIAYKVEPDSDIHLVLQSTRGSHPTMIAEIPDPSCAAESRVLAQIIAARAAFVAQVGQPQTYFVHVTDTVSLAGVGYYDFLHGQTGVAPNGIELHPVIEFRMSGTSSKIR